MPANSKAALTDAQKKILRWTSSRASSPSPIPSLADEAMDKAMQDLWAEVIQK